MENTNLKKTKDKQIVEYSTLPWYKSHRKISSIIIFILSIFTFGVGFIVTLPLTYFIYRGNIIAIWLGQLFLIFSLTVASFSLVLLLKNTEGGISNYIHIWYGSIFVLLVHILPAQQLWFAHEIENTRKINQNIN